MARWLPHDGSRTALLLLDQEMFLIIFELDELRPLWLISKIFIDRLIASRPGQVVVFVDKYDAAHLHPGIKEFEARFV